MPRRRANSSRLACAALCASTRRGKSSAALRIALSRSRSASTSLALGEQRRVDPQRADRRLVRRLPPPQADRAPRRGLCLDERCSPIREGPRGDRRAGRRRLRALARRPARRASFAPVRCARCSRASARPVSSCSAFRWFSRARARSTASSAPFNASAVTIASRRRRSASSWRSSATIKVLAGGLARREQRVGLGGESLPSGATTRLGRPNSPRGSRQARRPPRSSASPPSRNACAVSPNSLSKVLRSTAPSARRSASSGTGLSPSSTSVFLLPLRRRNASSEPSARRNAPPTRSSRMSCANA